MQTLYRTILYDNNKKKIQICKINDKTLVVLENKK